MPRRGVLGLVATGIVLACWTCRFVLGWSANGKLIRAPRQLQHSTQRQPLCAAVNEVQSRQVESIKDKGRPFEQRVDQPRPARRMNHPFKYLYRHDFDETEDLTPMEYLIRHGGYTEDQVVALNRSFPVLLSLSTRHQIHPKLQFLKHTLGQSPARVMDSVPPFYFGARLERIVAPRHAFLVWVGLPSGARLFSLANAATAGALHPPTTLFQEFMLTCRNSKQFAAMCQSWYQTYGLTHTSLDATGAGAALFHNRSMTAKDVEAFDALFARGLLSAVRNDLVQPTNPWPLQQLPTLQAHDLVTLLMQHGAHALERDYRGATLLHWACGTGHDRAAQVLMARFPCLATTVATRDGATPLHWAAAGSSAREFGIGGHATLCQALLAHVQSSTHSTSVLEYVNGLTLDGNSALMWAAWSGTLDTVKLLIRNRADASVRNRNGCTVAHWAASGGNVAVCRYLHAVAPTEIDFTAPNHGGNTPLTHAVAFGRTDVIAWLMRVTPKQHTQLDALDESVSRDDTAYRLAQDFVRWSNGQDSQRQNVLQLFDDELYNMPLAMEDFGDE